MAKSYSQLVQERERLEAAIEAARKKETDGVIKRIREAIRVYNITAQDLGFNEDGVFVEAPQKRKYAKRLGKKRPVKYSDGNGNTWAGGGYMPVWLRERIEGGAKLEDFLVKKAA